MGLELKGVLGPVVTTFDGKTGELDRRQFESNIRAHLAAGLHGVVVGGSTGEAALLDEAERGALVDVARKIVSDEQRLIVGTGAESTRTARRYAKLAAERGADAVLVVAPHYYGAKAMTAVALRAHYTAIADDSPVPVMLYNIPKYMHFALPPQLVEDLAQHENIVGIKDSSGDLELLRGYLQAQSETFSVLTGNGSTFARALQMGVRGGILAVALFAPALALDVYSGVNPEQAQEPLALLSARIVGDMGVPGVKAALDQIGLAGGAVRPPLTPVSSGDASEIGELLRVAELSRAA